jgi:hypothetical protein
MAVTYTSIYAGPNIGFGESGRRKQSTGTLAYVAQAYASGVPVTAGQLGFTTTIESLIILSAGPATTDIYKWDITNSTIRRYVETAGTYAEVAGNQTFNVVVQATGW